MEVEIPHVPRPEVTLGFLTAVLESLGYVPFNGYEFTVGDCLYDSFSFLIGEPAAQIRNKCMDVLPTVMGQCLMAGYPAVPVDLRVHGVPSVMEYRRRQRLSFATHGDASLQGDFACVQCFAFAYARDVVVWSVGNWELKFGHFGSAEPLQLFYTDNGRNGHFVPVVPKSLAQFFLLPLLEDPMVGCGCYVVQPNGCCVLGAGV